MRFRPATFLTWGATWIALSLCAMPARAQIGVAVTGVGPINRSMGGASVGTPLDAGGALYWNPATISGLPKSELEFGAELAYPQTKLSSSLPAGAFGLAGPPVPLAGSDRGDDGAFLLPSIGLVYHPEGSDITYGLGLYGAGGFAVNYPASFTNPILTPQPPRGLGLGNLAAEFDIVQLAPTLSYQLTDHLSLGFAPTVNLARLTADPAILVPPNPIGGGLGVFPAATHTRWTWGMGCQAGAYYSTDACWNFGASVKSPQWFESFRYNATDLLGNPRTLKVHFNYPLFASLGVSYTGFERWVFAGDIRYVDYHNTPGFSHFGFDASGAATGIGWDSVFCLALGTQYSVTDALALRIGYTYNMNPIPDARSAFNVASPTILEHALYAGASYRLTECFMLSLAYAHGFENSIKGLYITPLGAIPGSSVQSTTSADTILIGATVTF
jgi:long-chain fatty acid transport protein